MNQTLRKPTVGEYPEKRYASRRQDLVYTNWDYQNDGWKGQIPGGDTLRSRLEHALQLVTLLEAQQRTLNENDAEWVRDIFETLDGIERDTPRIELWCVVKEYHPRDTTSAWYGKESVWVGFFTKAQAEEFAPAIAKHYYKKQGNRDFGDKWIVKRAECGILSILREDLPIEHYLRSLG
jgi:hypothetical protein